MNEDENILVAINMFIANRQYKVDTPPGDEQYVRNAVTFIEDKIKLLRTFHNKDMQDKLSVILLNIAAHLLETRTRNNIRNAEIEKIDRELGIYLEKCSLDNIE
jgi:cell division protein ZapA (FtsZ GTPase activity inhibitor)